MHVPKQFVALLLLISLLLAACRVTDTTGSPAPLPTIAPTADNNQPQRTSVPLPPTNTPISSPDVSVPDIDDNLEVIDQILQEIDNDVCREAHETRAEIAALLAAGQDVADLEAAITELITELDNCSLDMTPNP